MKSANAALLLITGLVPGCLPDARAQDKQEQHTLRDGEARTGSKFRDVLVRSGGLPLLRCDQLNDEQIALLKAAYANMGEGDEPPFPAAGLAAIRC